jgi:hypothetical protein
MQTWPIACQQCTSWQQWQCAPQQSGALGRCDAAGVSFAAYSRAHSKLGFWDTSKGAVVAGPGLGGRHSSLLIGYQRMQAVRKHAVRLQTHMPANWRARVWQLNRVPMVGCVCTRRPFSQNFRAELHSHHGHHFMYPLICLDALKVCEGRYE